MRKDFVEIDRCLRDTGKVAAVFHAARFSFDGSDSFVASNSLLDVFLRFGFPADMLRRITVDGSVDTFLVVSAPASKLEELSELSAITARAAGLGSYLFIRKGCAYRISRNGIERESSGCGLCTDSFLDIESYANPFGALLPYGRKLRKGDYEAVSKAVEKLVC